MFVANRGWFDPSGQVPRLLVEIDRLLAGTRPRDLLPAHGLQTAAEPRPGAAAEPELDGDRRCCWWLPRPTRNGAARHGLRDLDRRAKFLVVVESALTPTAEAAHLVLPMPMFAEKEGTYVAGNASSSG